MVCSLLYSSQSDERALLTPLFRHLAGGWIGKNVVNKSMLTYLRKANVLYVRSQQLQAFPLFNVHRWHSNCGGVEIFRVSADGRNSTTSASIVAWISTPTSSQITSNKAQSAGFPGAISLKSPSFTNISTINESVFKLQSRRCNTDAPTNALVKYTWPNNY